jgi:adenosylhomocysteine nucleosidase
MIAIMSALEEEVREFKKGMVITKTSREQDCRIYEGNCAKKDSLLVLTGVGRERAQKTTEFILNKFPVNALVSTGFGGSLNGKTATGDIVIYAKINCEETPGGQPGKTLYSNPGLISAASKQGGNNGFNSLVGNGVTISEVCVTPESKRRLGQVFAADVVDMESYWIGQIAGQRNLPFIVLRSIFDTVQKDLSLLSHVTVEGKAAPLKAAGYFIGHPGQLGKVGSYVSDSQKAGRNLALFLHKFVKDV